MEDVIDEGKEEVSQEQMLEALKYLACEFDGLKERLTALEDYFHNEFVGGLLGMVSQQEDDIGIEGLKGEYGSMLSPYEGLHAKLHPMFGGSDDEDIYRAVWKKLKGIDDPEQKKAAVQAIVDQMAASKDTLAGLVGGPGSVAVKETVVAPGEEKIEPEAEEGESDPLAELAKRVEARKKGTRGATPISA